MDRYITSLVTNRDLLQKVIESTNSDELWSPTYAELFALMEKFGIIIVVTPSYTKAFHNHISWVYEVFEIYGKDSDCLECYTENTSYTTWVEAADHAIEHSCEIHDRQVRDIEEASLEEKFQELEKKRHERILKRHDKLEKERLEKEIAKGHESSHDMGHPLYGRHSDEDPLIYE